MVRRVKPLPVTTIQKAMRGDEDALAVVLACYQGYIRSLATRTVVDEYGNEYLCVDEYMRHRLEAKLINSIMFGFKILPS